MRKTILLGFRCQSILPVIPGLHYRYTHLSLSLSLPLSLSFKQCDWSTAYQQRKENKTKQKSIEDLFCDKTNLLHRVNPIWNIAIA